MDYHLRSSFDAGICITETSKSSIVTLAIIRPSNQTLVRDIVEVTLPLDAPEEALSHAIAELLPSNIVVNIVTLAVAVPVGDGKEFPSPCAQAVGTKLTTTTRAFPEIVKNVVGLELKENGKVLVVQPSHGGVSAAVVGKTTGSVLEFGEITRYHSTTAEELVSALASATSDVEQIILLPTAPSTQLAQLSHLLQAQHPILPILVTTPAQLAHAAAIDATRRASRMYSDGNFNWVLPASISVATASGDLLSLVQAGQMPVARGALVMEVEEEGQTSATLRIVLQETTGNEYTLDTIALDSLVQPATGKPKIRVEVLVKRSYDVAISVTQVGLPDGPGVVLHYPALVKRIGNDVKGVYREEFREERELEGDVKIAGFLPK